MAYASVTKLPSDVDNATAWLPIDAKFPLEDYQKLVSAQEHADLPLGRGHASTGRAGSTHRQFNVTPS